MTEFAHGTYLQGEEFAYPNGKQSRRGLAIYPDGQVRRVWAGIPDTFFSIPAHGRMFDSYLAGYVYVDDKLIDCPGRTEHSGGIGSPHHPDGGLHCELCQFGLVRSPTYGALIFRPNMESVRRHNGKQTDLGHCIILDHPTTTQEAA